MSKLLSIMVTMVFSTAFVGLGVVQAKVALEGSSSLILVSEKSAEKHGKAGGDHGKDGDHGKADHKGKDGDDHEKKKDHKKKSTPDISPQ